MKIIDDPSLREKIKIFRDRVDAAEKLAERLSEYKDRTDAVVLAIPSGGAPIGLILSRKLNLDFNLVMVRKIHLPWNPEAGFGAVAWDGTYLLNHELVELTQLSPNIIAKCISNEINEIKFQMREWGLIEYNLDVKDKVAIITDDGLASGYTMSVAVETVKKRGSKQVIVAVPTGSSEALRMLHDKVDMIICLNVRSSRVFAVADAYIEWRDISHDEVKNLLAEYNYARKLR
jgi:predicted phosphoribosyltransferase